MHYVSSEAGYMRSANSHKRSRWNRWLNARVYRYVVWVGALNTGVWGFVAYEVFGFITFALFSGMILAWMAAFAPVGF